jgi:hypothetical protein
LLLELPELPELPVPFCIWDGIGDGCQAARSRMLGWTTALAEEEVAPAAPAAPAAVVTSLGAGAAAMSGAPALASRRAPSHPADAARQTTPSTTREVTERDILDFVDRRPT